MKIIDMSVSNGTAVVVGMILVIMFGLLTLDRIPVQLNPTIDRPIISVETEYDGAAPGEIETEVTNRQELRLAGVENLRRLRSTSAEGESNIWLEFDWGVDKNIAMLDIMKKLERVRDLPEDVEKPQIRAINSEDEKTIVRATVQTNLPVDQVRELMESQVGPRIERIKGVGAIRWYGGSRREIHVLLDLAALDSRHVTIEEVLNAVDRENQNVRGGKIEEGGSRMLVRTVGQYASLEEIRNTVIKNSDQGIIRVSDIAEVVDSVADRETRSRTNGKPAVTMSISKKIGENTLDVAKRIHEEIDRINEGYASSDINLWVNYDASDYILRSIRGISKNLILGAILAVVVLYFFLRSLVATFIIALTIPLCLIGTFVLLAAFGRSVNVISMAGLALAAGMVVDNAVVVMENIFRHRTDFKSDPFKAAREAASEVWGPILASSLTTLAVFLPILFIKEEAGQLFRDIAYSISFAVALSMVAAITVVPMLASRLMHGLPGAGGAMPDRLDQPGPDGHEKGSVPRRRFNPVDAVGRAVGRFFLAVIGAGLKNKLVRTGVISAIFAAFFASLLLKPPAEYLPQSKSAMIFGRVTIPTGASLEGVDRQMKKIEHYVLTQIPELYRFWCVARRERTMFGLYLKDEVATSENADRVLADLEDFIASSLPSDIQVNASRVSDFGWRFKGKNIEIDISGPDLAYLESFATEIEEQFMMMPEVKTVLSSLQVANPELQIFPDRERLADLGMTSRDIARVVETLLEGTRASLYREGGREYELRVKAREGQILHPDRLRAVIINTPSGQKVRLDEVARIKKRLGPVRIEHLEKERVITLDVKIGDQVPLQTFIAKCQREIIDPYRQQLPPDYGIVLSGTADDLARTMKALAGSFILALVIIYLLMAALFESFFYPSIIMFSVPLAMTGGFIGVRVSGAEFNVITMFGFVMLAGIVVNNAILLIDFTLRSVRGGVEIHEAVMSAVRVRMRPIFMTSFTTVLGMTPLALGKGVGTELYSGLGAAVVGGMVLSTFFTLLLIPFLLSFYLELRQWTIASFGGWRRVPDPQQIAK